MTWNYRIVRYRDGGGYGLHEVYYNQDGKPVSMTDQPIGFGCDANQDPVDEIVGSLKLALDDATNRPILDEASEWPTAENRHGET